MVKFGMLFILGSYWLQSSQRLFINTLFNFDRWVASQKPFTLPSTWFGSLGFGSFGVTETLESSNKRKILLINFWTKLSYNSSGGWRQIILIFLFITIHGGLTLICVWELLLSLFLFRSLFNVSKRGLCGFSACFLDDWCNSYFFPLVLFRHSLCLRD